MSVPLTQMTVSSTELKELSETQKKAGQRILHALRKYVTAIKKRVEIFTSITWMTGVNGKYALLGMSKTDYTLVPTGELLSRNSAPMKGTFDDGVTSDGLNQSFLSGVEPHNFGTAWGYACNHINEPLDPLQNIEKGMIKTISELMSILAPKAKDKFLDHDNLNQIVRLNLLILQLRQLNEKAYEELAPELNSFLALMLNEEHWLVGKQRAKILEALNLSIPEKIYQDRKLDAEVLREFLKHNAIPETIKRNFSNASWVETVVRYPNEIPSMTDRFKDDLTRDFDIHFRSGNIPALLTFLKVFSPEYLDKNRIDALHQDIDKEYKVLQKFLSQLSSAIKKGPAFRFSESERQMIEKTKSFPVVFAATEALKVRHGRHEEAVKDSLRLEKQLQVIITDDEGVKPVKLFLNQHRLKKVLVCTKDEYLRRMDGLKQRRGA